MQIILGTSVLSTNDYVNIKISALDGNDYGIYLDSYQSSSGFPTSFYKDTMAMQVGLFITPISQQGSCSVVRYVSKATKLIKY